MSINLVSYFEIPVLDLDRAVAFYEKVFAIELQRTRIDGNEMALFPWQDDAPGASGALAKGDSYMPGRAGARLYFGVESIDATLAVAVAAGASVLYPVTAVPGAGWVAEFLDSEGNCIALQGSAR
ncbi:VOC family protein [Roseateles cavernae]|uniref:VOC family protein n=1 Tax=Roseateles cavernae TaxID=3153578 RepID=UPI0032E4ED5B